jgi:hypothetical protein
MTAIGLVTDEEIVEALDDAVTDGEGRLHADHIRHHLERAGLMVVRKATHEALMTELLALAERFKRALIHDGTEAEFAEYAVAQARAFLSTARGES